MASSASTLACYTLLMASATGTVRRIGTWMVAAGLVAVGGGCRSCAEDTAAAPDAHVAQPTMPTGMLMPGASADAGANAGTGSLRVARGIKAGAWTELQIAKAGERAEQAHFQHWRDDSWFVSLEAMTLLHEAFARALLGFDLFLPRLFPPDALVKLAAELDGFARGASGDIAATARELAQIASAAAVKQQSLWVLGP